MLARMRAWPRKPAPLHRRQHFVPYNYNKFVKEKPYNVSMKDNTIHHTPTVARVVRRGTGETGSEASNPSGRSLLCIPAGVSRELVAGPAGRVGQGSAA